MNFTELRRLINDLRHRGYDAQELQVDLYSKTSFPLVPLTLVILGLPFCFRLGRHGSLYGIAIAILLAGIYFLLFSATSALGGTGLMPAFLAAWAPNILFIGAGTYLLLKTGT
jgi:lipopolysaccharide export LptBFGC system permease protein LptF